MGISPVFVRFAEVGPFASAFWRVGLALPLLWLWLLWEVRRTGMTIRSAMQFDTAILLAGIFFAGDLFFWHLAILNTSITNATLLACLAPVWCGGQTGGVRWPALARSGRCAHRAVLPDGYSQGLVTVYFVSYITFIPTGALLPAATRCQHAYSSRPRSELSHFSCFLERRSKSD